jgi:hypothetical protein
MLYCDRRLGGIERWCWGDPDEVNMRLPDETKDCVCFLCVEQISAGPERFRYIGTAFFVWVPSEAPVEGGYIYLVTAKHCVERATHEGALYVRLNTRVGGVRHIQLTGEWLYPEEEAVDVAVLPIDFPQDTYDYKCVDLNTLVVTDTIMQEYDIGIGDVLYMCGLFSLRSGTQRNIPILRTGIIAAMPDEPLQDADTGLEYRAYLAEVRSIGGVSGSPVFVALEHGRIPNPQRILGRRVWLLGLIRGHWDLRQSQAGPVAAQASEAVNTGIALVTPSQEVYKLLMREDLIMERRREDRELRKRNAPTLDSNLPFWRPFS